MQWAKISRGHDAMASHFSSQRTRKATSVNFNSCFNNEVLAMSDGADKVSYLVTRRGVLSGGAAMRTSGAVLSHQTTVHAAALIAGKQAPGFYRYKVGDFEVTVVIDGALAFP